MKPWHGVGIMVLSLVLVWGCGTPEVLQGREGQGRGQPSRAGTLQPERFSKAADGVITDRATGLDWYVSPQPHNSWHEAKAWTEHLTVAGGGWRLPTLAELKALYQKGASAIHTDPAFQAPGAWVWSGELKDPSFAWGFAFYSGLEGWHSLDYGCGRVAFAVRSRK
uniref:DUF1566 domain-containing protein n=1 Tax=Desulfobacca acetoxidans TaxID=60893 RepID=A0A7V4G8G8_9BACT